MEASPTISPNGGVARLSRSGALLALLALTVVAAACGSARAAETPAVAPPSLVTTPTPVPTTAPIILPPETLDLPAVAVLPDAPVPNDVAARPDVAAASIDGSSTAGTADTATGQVSATQPAETTVSSAAVVGPVVPASVDRWDPCVVQTAQTQGAEALLDAIAASPETDLTSQQLNDLAAAAASCGIVATNLAATDLAVHLDTSTSCLNQWLASDAAGSVFVGLTSIGWGVATPAWASDHLQSSMQSCFSGASFAAVVMADVASEPRLAGAFDSACLATSFEQSGILPGYAGTLASAPLSASLNISLGDSWVLGCANVGQMVAVAAADDGVTLSATTIACIDAELTSSGLVAPLIAGTADSEAVGVATITCLSDAEAAALLG